jgi:hypothetical protein
MYTGKEFFQCSTEFSTESMFKYWLYLEGRTEGRNEGRKEGRKERRKEERRGASSFSEENLRIHSHIFRVTSSLVLEGQTLLSC